MDKNIDFGTVADLYLLCGMAFAGKSTLAAALSRRLGAEVVSLDALNAARGLDGGAGITDKEWARSHQEALAAVDRGLAAGRPVIVDDTNCFRLLRDTYRAVAERHGARTLVLYLDRPLDLLNERRRANERTGSRPPIAEPVLLDLLHKFEPPGPDEDVLAVPPGADLEDWIVRRLQLPPGT